jgi:site-specific DNA-cytosine methylase
VFFDKSEQRCGCFSIQVSSGEPPAASSSTPPGSAPTSKPARLADMQPPIAKAVAAMMQKLPARTVNNLRSMLCRRTGPITFGSACSGCDIVHHVLSTMSKTMKTSLSAPVDFKQIFACENQEEKIEFLRQEFKDDISYIFERVESLGDKSAKDLKTGERVVIPWVEWLFAGFSCTSRSNFNVNRKANKGCLLNDTEAATNVTWRGVKGYIISHKPSIITLENVRELLQSVGGNGDSDADEVIRWLEEQGYTSVYQEILAQDHGSFVPRARLYVFAFLSSAVDEVVISDLADILDRVKTSPEESCGLDEYLLSMDEVAEYEPVDRAPKQLKREPEDLKFKHEHCELFAEHQIPWPADLSRMSPEFQKGAAFLSERNKDFVVYLETVWPPDAENPKAQFADINQSMAFLLKKSQPFREDIGCLTGSGTYWLRTPLPSSPGQPVKFLYRMVLGVELMGFVGWHLSFFRQRPASTVQMNKLLSSFAGNAFSAFAVAATILGSLSVWAGPKMAKAPQDVVEDGASSDSD